MELSLVLPYRSTKSVSGQILSPQSTQARSGKNQGENRKHNCEDDSILAVSPPKGERAMKSTEDKWDMIRSSLLSKLPEVKCERAKQAQFMVR